mmetsp:Transcript_14797/g.2137  ORF Transcript_14797/g.2137 Transcript_14797/m.2137 type:complete len:114 (+) Transcript_14797:452-793(+)
MYLYGLDTSFIEQYKVRFRFYIIKVFFFVYNKDKLIIKNLHSFHQVSSFINNRHSFICRYIAYFIRRNFPDKRLGIFLRHIKRTYLIKCFILLEYRILSSPNNFINFSLNKIN